MRTAPRLAAPTLLGLRALALSFCCTLLACAQEQRSETPSCTFESWQACDAPSADVRSEGWPEHREQLAQLANATEQAVAAPQRWDTPLAKVGAPPWDRVASAWAAPVYFKDREQRLFPIVQADIKFSNLFNVLANLSISRAPLNIDAAARGVTEARDAFSRLKAESLFRDPFGQPEPRMALFSYARAATLIQFLERPKLRRPIADESSAFLEKRLQEWEAMQRARLAQKSSSEIQAAVDSIGAPEIRRLTAAWRAIENLDIPLIDDEQQRADE
jgi:hypothetical protein